MALQVGPLSWQVPIVDGQGRATKEFALKWGQLVKAAGISPTDAAGMSALLDLIGGTEGDLLRRGAVDWEALGADGDSTKYLSADGTYTVPAGSGGGGGSTVGVQLSKQAGTQAVAGSTDTKVDWDTTDYADAGFTVDLSLDKITVTAAGYYAFFAHLRFTASTNTHLYIALMVNGVLTRVSTHTDWANLEDITLAGIVLLGAGDVLTLQVRSTNPITISNTPAAYPNALIFNVAKMGSGGVAGAPGDWFLNAGLISPASAGGTYNPDDFAAFPFVPSADMTLSGVEVFATALGSGRQLIAGLYADNGNSYAGGALLGTSALTTPTLGISALPFTVPVAVTKNTLYWVGLLGHGGSGNLQLVKVSPAKDNYGFYHNTGAALANPAPAVTYGTGGTQFSWWLY